MTRLKTNDEAFTPHTTIHKLIRYISVNKASYLFMLPFTIVFATFTIFPVLRAIGLSFTMFNILEAPVFVGWANYRQLFIQDDVFLIAIKNTLVIAAILGPAGYLLSLLFAWLINELSPKIRAFMTLLFYAPAMANVFVIWKIIFSPDEFGFANAYLARYGIIDNAIPWLQQEEYMFAAVIIILLWASLGTSFLAFIAGFQTIDPVLYEAGAVDGVKNRFQELWFITLPSIKPQLLFGSVMSITAAFGVGDAITALVGFPSPNYAVHTVVTHLADHGFLRFLKLREAKEEDDDLEKVYADAFSFVTNTKHEAGAILRVSLLAEAFRLGMAPDEIMAAMNIEQADYLISRMVFLDERTLLLYRCLAKWQESVDDSFFPIARYIAMRIGAFAFTKINKNKEEEYLASFETLMTRLHDWDKQLYRPELMDGSGSPLLPPVKQAVCSANVAFSLEREQDYAGALRALRAALEKDATLREPIKTLCGKIAAVTNRINKQQDAVSGEFALLLHGVKQRTQAIIASGQHHLALPLIAQLERLAPNDPEIKELKLQIGSFLQ